MRNHCRSSSYYSMMLLSIILLCSISHSDASFSERKSFLDILGLSERVVGGKPVADDMFPWIVFIQANHKYKNNTQTSNLCGGSLIHARLVWLFHLSYLAHEVRATLHGRWNDVKALKTTSWQRCSDVVCWLGRESTVDPWKCVKKVTKCMAVFCIR